MGTRVYAVQYPGTTMPQDHTQPAYNKPKSSHARASRRRRDNTAGECGYEDAMPQSSEHDGVDRPMLPTRGCEDSRVKTEGVCEPTCGVDKNVVQFIATCTAAATAAAIQATSEKVRDTCV